MRRQRPGRGERGVVLAQVLMMSILMALLSANIIQMMMHRAQGAQHVAGGAQGAGTTEGAAQALSAVWMNGGACSSGWSGGAVNVGVQVICGGPSAGCATCRCTFSVPAPNFYNGISACVNGAAVSVCAPKFPGDACP